MDFIDTNVLYYAYSKNDFEISDEGAIITSINALEFLKNIEKEHNNKAKYYIPSVKSTSLKFDPFFLIAKKRDHPFGKRYTDFIKFDFKHDFDSYILYNNESIENVINTFNIELFKSSISFLDKETYKELLSRFKFLLNNNIFCESISANDIELGYYILDAFLNKYSIKDDFRNSWNDILILSKCLNQGERLITHDKLLNELAIELFHVEIEWHNKYIEIAFPESRKKKIEDKQRESKGYINRSWQYKFRRKLFDE